MVTDWRHIAIRVRLARRIREVRVERGLTQYDVAQRAEMHRPVFSRIERAVHCIDLATLERVAAALDVHLRVFLVEIDAVNFFWERAQRRGAA